MNITPEILTALGITKEEVIEAAAKAIVMDTCGGIESESYSERFLQQVQNESKKYIDQTVTRIVTEKCDEVFLPLLQAKLDGYMFTQTNSWGEATGEPLTTTEFIVKKIENYMQEQVDRSGRNKAECQARHDSFYGSMPRITYQIDSYFAPLMQKALEQVMKDGANILTGNIGKAVEAALQDIHKRLTCTVTVASAR